MQGMSLVPAVTELMLAELLYLQYDNPTRPNLHVYKLCRGAGGSTAAAPPASKSRGQPPHLARVPALAILARVAAPICKTLAS